MIRLFHHTLSKGAQTSPQAIALRHKEQSLSYGELGQQVETLASQLMKLGLMPGDRVAIYLPKQFETVVSFYAVSMAGGVFVPVNPLLKPAQVKYILDDCAVKMLITSLSRFQQLSNHFELTGQERKILLTDCTLENTPQNCENWTSLQRPTMDLDTEYPPRISQDIAAILYTSGSTGSPKGVVLSHKNLVVGAMSVAEYLHNHADDRILAILPFSFDYGLSQITTAFLSGAQLVLMEYLLPRDVIRAVEKYQITALAAVPPVWLQLAELDWPEAAQKSLRYITNSGGVMPKPILQQLMIKLPDTLVYLMYGLTEAFRSTYLDPYEVSKRPNSIGKAIPDAEILVINNQGQECAPGEEGELVHRGPHVARGYWNAPHKTAERFKPLPAAVLEKLPDGLNGEMAVWSGDTVVKDQQGFLYFVGRKDEMIKSSGYRVSPSEIEEVVYQFEAVAEAVALGVPHPLLGQAILLLVKPDDPETFDPQGLLAFCQKALPNYMQPKMLKVKNELPRNPNGKLDRKALAEKYVDVFAEPAAPEPGHE